MGSGYIMSVWVQFKKDDILDIIGEKILYARLHDRSFITVTMEEYHRMCSALARYEKYPTSLYGSTFNLINNKVTKVMGYDVVIVE
jgi:hypothetical protein